MEEFRNNKKEHGMVGIPKRKRERPKRTIRELMEDYTQNSTLHGLRYIGEKERSVVEKLFWLLVFLVSIGLCASLIRNVYYKWQNSPVLVTINDYIVPVRNVPFPSVTICPQIKSDATKYNFTKEYLAYLYYYKKSNQSQEYFSDNFTKTEDLMTVCVKGEKSYTLHNITSSRLVDNILQVSYSSQKVFSVCWWRNKYHNCSKIFKRVLTFEGLCYNFNSLAVDEIFHMNSIQSDYEYLEPDTRHNDWSPDTGYKTYDDDVHPRRGRENGAKPDLVLELREINNSTDVMCNRYFSGFKIFLQNPADQPQASMYYYAAIEGQTTNLALKFNMISTSDELKKYSPDTRKCYFQNERPLRYFRIYTTNNCRLECQTNYTLSRCDCVWFHMPHNDSKQLCAANKWECVQTALDDMALQEMEAEQGLEVDDTCKCLPECQSVYYDAEALLTKYDYKRIQTYNDNSRKSKNNSVTVDRIITYKNFSYSIVAMYFKQPRFVAMKRSEMFGTTDFLSNCGGLLGLFLGFSFLSLVEMVYFVSLRLYYIFKKDQKQNQVDKAMQGQTGQTFRLAFAPRAPAYACSSQTWLAEPSPLHRKNKKWLRPKQAISLQERKFRESPETRFRKFLNGDNF